MFVGRSLLAEDQPAFVFVAASVLQVQGFVALLPAVPFIPLTSSKCDDALSYHDDTLRVSRSFILCTSTSSYHAIPCPAQRYPTQSDSLFARLLASTCMPLFAGISPLFMGACFVCHRETHRAAGPCTSLPLLPSYCTILSV